MSGIDLLIKCLEGEYVLKKAQKIDTNETNRNSRKGNTKGVGIFTNIALWNEILQPTQEPITTPLIELATTRMNASYMYSLVIISFVNPIERITAMSFDYSLRLPIILLESEKKQMNIVMEITTLNIVSRVISAS